MTSQDGLSNNTRWALDAYQKNIITSREMVEGFLFELTFRPSYGYSPFSPDEVDGNFPEILKLLPEQVQSDFRITLELIAKNNFIWIPGAGGGVIPAPPANPQALQRIHQILTN